MALEDAAPLISEMQMLNAIRVAAESGGGGSSTPGLPAWTYTAGAMAAGMLKTNDTSPSTTSLLSFSDSATLGDGSFQSYFAGASIGVGVLLTGSTGKSHLFVVAAVTDQTGYTDVAVTPTAAVDTTAWSGDYQVLLVPLNIVTGVNGAAGEITLLPPDTGWTANASGGDKTQAVADYTPPSFTGGDTISETNVNSLATQVQALTKKLQAIETALASNLRPNA